MVDNGACASITNSRERCDGVIGSKRGGMARNSDRTSIVDRAGAVAVLGA